MEFLRSGLVSLLRYGYFSLIVVLLVISIVNAEACNAQSSEGKREGELILTMDPPLTFVNESRDVIFRVNVLKGVNDVVDAVRLMEMDVEGNPIAEAGIMNDNGENGDQEAGNGSYAITLTFNETAPVTRYYQAVISLKNDSRKILSGVEEFRIIEEPYSKEPEEDKIIYGQGLPFPVNQIIVRLNEDEPKATAQALANLVGATIIGYTATVNSYLFEVPSTTVEELDSISERLKNDPRVAGVMRNFAMGPEPMPTD